MLIAAAVVAVTGFVIRQSLRGELVPAGETPGRTAPAAARPAEPAASGPAARPEALPDDRTPTSVQGRAAGPGGGASGPPRAPAAPPREQSAAPRVESHASESSGGERQERYALEVATFIFEERARVEQERLEARGHSARVTRTLEHGSHVYRVVVGSYPSPAAAERAADSLLASGIVLQARVVRRPARR